MKFINQLNKMKKYLHPNDDFKIKQEISNDEIQVKINDSAFTCGDLYITVFASESDNVVTQSGFLINA